MDTGKGDAREQPESGAQTFPISLHVPGILRLLSEHLYSDPSVALRELIQNAANSCQRRRLETSSVDGYTPHIDLHIDAEQRALVVTDNGSGLTREEIHTYLATIGRGYTAELRERLEVGGRDAAYELIGQFGLGLLAAFLVADQIEMVTRSVQADSPGWRWSSHGDETYTLGRAERAEPGTTLTLHLKLAGEFLLNPGVVREAIRSYADFLRVPITLDGGQEPVNVGDAPWHRGAPLDAYRTYIAGRFGASDPLTVIPLHDHVETLHLPGGGEDRAVTPLRGVLFIPTGSTLSIQEYGDLTVYVRRMLVSEQERDLLPRWARFVRGVVDCPALNPTASREQVRRDEAFYLVQRALEAQIIAHLQALAETNPRIWRAIVQQHNDLIKGWALESHTFFAAVCELVTFETSRGRLPLPEILSAGDGTIYYFVDELGATQEKMLYEARGLVVIDASRFAEESFLKAYARTHEGVDLIQLEPGAAFLFEPVEDPLGRWEPIVRYYIEQGTAARLVRFKPVDIPAILVFAPGSDQAAGARAALEGGMLSGPLARLVEEYLRVRGQPANAAGGTLHLNAANPLMQRLLTLPPSEEAFTAALEIVYHNARFFAGQALTPDEARQSFGMIGYSLEQLIRALADSTPPPGEDRQDAG